MDGGGAVRGRYGPEAGGGNLTTVPRTAKTKGRLRHAAVDGNRQRDGQRTICPAGGGSWT